MAPGRRRGGGRSKGTSELRLGDLVLAKVKGFPAWPAKISQPEEWGKTPDPRKYFVYFFGTAEIAFVAPVDIQAFTVEVKNKLVGRCKGKPLKFTQAVEEICEEFEKLQPKKLNGFEDDTSRDVLGSEDCSNDADGDNAMEVDMTDDSIVNKSHLQMGTNRLDGSISPLERCSQRPGSIDLEERKPSTAGHVDASVSPGIHGKKGTCKIDGPIFLKKEVVSTSGSCSDYLSKKEGSGKLTNVQRGQSKRASQNTEVHSDKRSNSLTDATAKVSTQTNKKVESTSSKDVKRSEWKGKMDNHPTSGLSNSHPEEDALPPSKRHCRAVEVTEERVRKNTASSRIEPSSGVSVKSSFSVATKRRAVRLCDDEEEEAPKTPIHAASASQVSCSVDTAEKNSALSRSSTAFQVMKKRLRVEDRSAKDLSSVQRPVEDASPSSLKIVETKLKKTGAKNSSLSPKKMVSEKISVKDEKTAPSSPKMSPPIEDASRSSLKNVEEKLRKPGGKNSYLSPKKLGSEKISIKAVRPVEDASPSSLKIAETKLKKTGAKNSSLSPKKLVSEKISVKDEKTAPSSPKMSPPVEDASRSSLKDVEEKLRKTGGKNSYLSPKKLGSEKISIKDGKTPFCSPKVSSRSTPGIENTSNGEATKPPECNSQKKSPTSQGIVSGVGERSRTPLHKQMSERNKHNSISERRKATPKSISHLTDAVLASGGVSGNGSVPGKRLEGSRTDKISSLEDVKITDPDTSMKDLIAAAQAKKRLAHLQNLNSNVLFATAMHAEAARSSPSSVSPVLPLGSSSVVRSDALGLQDHSVSPLSDVQRLSTPFQPETEQCKEKKPESGNCVTETSLSGGTEAAVVRDAFEGMIETLSRTKESISRATRLAIDCAKYGIASEVIELLIRKLQSENSMHRKVDLFFLVDSITQCSHNHKGIAGASYVPTVQAALSRLLGVVAPPGAAARENRRQCLKVLRLWLSRKILPEAFLQPFMDELGVSNGETSSGLTHRRPSRIDRAFDDPIREIEGMLVDEYGSNATSQLAGLFPFHSFDGNDDDDDEEIMPFNVYKDVSEKSSGEHTPGTVDAENPTVTPNERRHCILEDVDGELEMEDVCIPVKDERHSYSFPITEVATSDIYLEISSNNSELPPLPEGSPPLPPDSPPETPPLPSSPPPVLPRQPPTLPPPLQSLSQTNPFPLPPVGLSSGLLSQQPSQTQPSTAPQFYQPLPPSILSTPLVYQHQPSTNVVSMPSSGNQLIQSAATAPHRLHGGIPGRNDVYGQFPCFLPLEARNPQEPSQPIEYSQVNAYGNTPSSQPCQQFQLPFSQAPLHPNVPSQNQPNHLAYSHPSAPKLYPHPQHTYPQSFSLPNLPDAPRLYAADDHWRAGPLEFNNDYQSNSWMARGRSSSGAPYAHEGFPGSLPERPSPSSFSSQPPKPSTLAAGAAISGHVMTGQVDLHAHNWRPA